MPRKPEEWVVDEGYDLTPDMPIKALMDRKPFKLSEDKKGHDVTLGARFPKSFDRWVEKIKEVKGSPYKIKSDVVRDCVYIGLLVLNMRYNLDPDWKIEARLAEEKSKIQDDVRIFKEVEEVVDRGIAMVCKNGHKEQAVKATTNYCDLISSFKDDRKRLYQQAFISRLKKQDLDQSVIDELVGIVLKIVK